MGALSRFDLARMSTQYGLLHFVETGTGIGQSLAYACRFGFRTLWSCEIEASLAFRAVAVFAQDRRVTIWERESQNFLEHTCRVIPDDEPVLFWLDAHFPGADYGIRGYGAEKNEAIRLPLPSELEIIARYRPDGRDVILCDDLRVWIDAPFASGNLPESVRPFCPRERSAEMFERVLGTTHTVTLRYEDEGYVMLTPNKVPAAADAA